MILVAISITASPIGTNNGIITNSGKFQDQFLISFEDDSRFCVNLTLQF